MAVRTGAEYLESIRDGREVWMQGKRVEDVTVEPGLARGAHTLAQFMDNQTDDPDTLTFQEGDERFPMYICSSAVTDAQNVCNTEASFCLEEQCTSP